MITPTKAASLVKKAQIEQAKKDRAERRVQKKAAELRAKNDAKQKVFLIAKDKREVLKTIEESASSGEIGTRYTLYPDEFILYRQEALVKFLQKKGFKAEDYSHYNEGSNYRDPDWPDTPGYWTHGVKIDWKKEKK